MEIISYNNNVHRNETIAIWKTVFGYKDKRNSPGLSIDNKLSANDGLFFVAINSQTIIGTIMAGYDGHRGWIYSLAVLDEYRKKGIGTKLLKYAEKQLIKLGCVKINLQILKSNETTMQFYLQNGYRVEERISMGKAIKENIR